MSVLMEVYNIESSHVTNTVDCKTDLGRLYRKADEQLEQAHEDQLREKEDQIGKLKNDLDLSQRNVLQEMTMLGFKSDFDGTDFIVKQVSRK